MEYKKLNNITGWVVFLIATIVYLATCEPTASWWDCGEFIATSYKLEVGHPPGAPLFMMLGRFFTLFGGGEAFFGGPSENAAFMVNALSAISSSFTILFLFWSITMLAKKLFVKEEILSKANQYAILGAGVIGSLVYTFSDSFWFSAVEGEVYALSSFFTAIVFWAILKWDNVADEKHSSRWLILIGFLMGLSIGVHLLNLLAIPALAYVVYYRKYKPSTKGFFTTGIIGLFALLTIQYGIIPGIVSIAASIEKAFVNDFGFGFNSGNAFYAICVVGILVFAIFYTTKKKMALLNTIVLFVSFIIIGYSSYAMIVIRSSANPPMDENNPENAFTLLSYLNREQYGDRPLFKGQQFNSIPVDSEEGDIIWRKGKEKYENAGKRFSYVYEPTVFFPRMYSSQPNHKKAYKEWTDFEGRNVKVKTKDGKSQKVKMPTVGENFKFFINYQVGHMYLRYFMWNFAGRQNDIQGHGTIDKGNWISGLNFIDRERIGNQDNLPTSKQNIGNNKFYFLPLILGLIGMFFHFNKNNKDAFVVLLLFFMTGLAIVIYLNQYPYQPRERDYAYAASFYAFCIWVGFGVLALFNAIKEFKAKEYLYIPAVPLAVSIFLYLVQLANGSDFALSYSLFYISIILLILYLIVYILKLSVSNKVMQVGIVTLLCGIAPFVMAKDGWNDHDRSGKYAARDMAANYLNACEPNAILFTNGDNDTFPLWYAQEVEGIRTDVRVVNLALLGGEWYIEQMGRKAYDSDVIPATISQDNYVQGKNAYFNIIDWKLPSHAPIHMQSIVNSATAEVSSKGYFELKKLVEMVEQGKLKYEGDDRGFIPARKIGITIDSADVVSRGLVPADKLNSIPKAITWDIKKSALYKHELFVMDVIASNNWERPIYFVAPYSVDDYINIDQYTQMEGNIHKLVPYKNTGYKIANDIMYDNVMNKFKFGGINQSDVNIDTETMRMTSNYRNGIFGMLSLSLIQEGKLEKAKNILDKCFVEIPAEKVPLNEYSVLLLDGYMNIANSKVASKNLSDSARIEANKVLDIYYNLIKENIDYYHSLKPKFAENYKESMGRSKDVKMFKDFNILMNIIESCNRFNFKEQKIKLVTLFVDILEDDIAYQANYYAKVDDIEAMGKERKIKRLKLNNITKNISINLSLIQSIAQQSINEPEIKEMVDKGYERMVEILSENHIKI